MFKIEYNIISVSSIDLDAITDDELRYNFLLGNVLFSSDHVQIDMAWEWVPLLDFSFCLCEIAKTLNNEEKRIEYFEFTESAETLKFSKDGRVLQIIPSFSSNIIETTFDEFDKEVKKLYYNIGMYIRDRFGDKATDNFFNKYL